jgi:hypothetical protein
MHKKAVTILLTVFSALLFSPGCKTGKKKAVLLNGYDLSAPEKFILPESLLEISGIAFHQGNSDTVYAIQDEEGKVFRLAWAIKKQQHSKFGKSGDYEDVSIINEMLYVLKSNGTIYSFPFIQAAFDKPAAVQEWKQLLPEGEYEGMYGAEADSMLYIICKSCPGDDDTKSTTVFKFKTGDSLKPAGNFRIDFDKVDIAGIKIKKDYKPSALAQHPRTHEWFILSAVNNLLLVADSAWKIKEGSTLKADIFPQPEGIAFDKEGNLFISNEGGDISSGNILKFSDSKTSKQ